MANILKEQRLIDNNKRALLKYVFISDGTTEANTKLVDVSTLANALDTTGQIMSGSTNVRSKYTTTIKRVYGNYSGTGHIKLQWHGDANSEIVVFGAGGVDLDFERRAEGAVIPNPEANTSGDILFSTSNVPTGAVFTLILDLRKDSIDYDAGQTRDPAAFNAGPYAGRNT
jgi:hypothetical protein